MVTPNPYALNISEKAFHPATKTEAATLLTNALTKTRSVAVGAMQVSLRWNGHRVANPSELLDLRTNVRVGTEILCEFLKGGQGDLPLVLGRYHTPNKDLESVAREYGRNVIAVWRNLIVLEQEGAK
jgi:soluble lytic murein transglycosylase-like protein